MQFQIPQFTEIEDKIVGPFTLKQFLYLAAGAVIIYVFYLLFPFLVFLLLSIPIAAICLALAFVRVNQQPLMNVVKNFFRFVKKPDLYVWKKPEAKKIVEAKADTEIIKKEPANKKEKLIPKEKLQEISWKIEVEK